jgi:hypothetical protein
MTRRAHTYRPRFGRTDKPQPGTAVEVWADWCNRCIPATWDGERWRTLDGQALPERVAYWYERR